MLVAAVAMAMAAHKGIFDLKDVQGPDRVKRESEREERGGRGRKVGCTHLRTPSTLTVM